MSVADWKTSYTIDYLNGPMSATLVTTNTRTGQVTVSVKSGTVTQGRRQRGNHTKNKLVKVGSMRWRNPSSYSRSINRWNYIPGAQKWSSKFFKSTYSCSGNYYYNLFSQGYNQIYFYGRLGNFSTDGENARNEAVNRMYEQLSSSKVDWGTNIAQTRQTVDEMSQLASDISLLYRGFRNKNADLIRKAVTHGESPAKAVSEQWLRWVYGIKPMMQDLYGTYGLLHKQLNTAHVFRVSGKASAHDNWFTNFNEDKKFTAKETVTVHVVCYCEILSTTLVTISNWGMINPLSVAWEATPFSFLVDWLVPVGSTLSALTAPMGYGVRSTTVTRKHEYQLNWTCNFPNDGYLDAPLSGSPPQIAITGIDLDRAVTGNFPLPGLYIKSPFSTAHTANALALLSSNKR